MGAVLPTDAPFARIQSEPPKGTGGDDLSDMQLHLHFGLFGSDDPDVFSTWDVSKLTPIDVAPTGVLPTAPTATAPVATAPVAAPPTAAPTTMAPVATSPTADLDPRLPALGVTVVDAAPVTGASFDLVSVKWTDEAASEGRHHIYVDVVDENGQRIVGQPVTISWDGGAVTGAVEAKPAPEYGFNFPMYAAGNAYDVSVAGIPSDVLVGAGMGDLNDRYKAVHTSYYLVFQRVTH